MSRQFYSMNTRAEADDLASALLEVLQGKEFLFASTTNRHADIELHTEHFLDRSGNNPVLVYDLVDGGYYINIYSTYGVHTINSDELDEAYISTGRGIVELREIRKSSDGESYKVYRLFRVTGKLEE